MNIFNHNHKKEHAIHNLSKACLNIMDKERYKQTQERDIYTKRVYTYCKVSLFAFFFLFFSVSACSQQISDSTLLQRVINYCQNLPSKNDTLKSNIYLRYYLDVDKRNCALAIIPTMYAISKGKKEFAGETYSEIFLTKDMIINGKQQISVGTIPNNKETMPILLNYLNPNLYNVAMINGQILSPFNNYNKNLYKYSITYLTDNRAEIIFLPKRRNTQLINGAAIVDLKKGRIIKIKFIGEHDMISFTANITMGKQGLYSLMPKESDITATFRFLGNKITTHYYARFDNPVDLPDTLQYKQQAMDIMNLIRPKALPYNIDRLYHDHKMALTRDIKNRQDSLLLKESQKRWDKILANTVEDCFINRTKGSFGVRQQGSFRISPILNPLQLSYSKRKGISYKMSLRGSYAFTSTKEFSVSMKGGYSFKQHQFYFDLPIRYTFNKEKNNYVEVAIGNGNRIINSSIIAQLKQETLDSIQWDKMNLDYFKNFKIKIISNYDFSEKVGVQLGLIFHRRSAVDKVGFEIAKRPINYYSFAPTIQLQYRPWGWNGIIFTSDYERGINGVGKADMEYERIELDASLRQNLYSLKVLSLRVGCGLYTTKNDKAYFLDYTNFREQNIPNGWNDDWTGDFQLLNSNWYNASEYYVRMNATYESPLMLLSKIPYVGKFIETERIYTNILFVDHLHPYTECGYGFTNRYLSIGFFCAARNQSFYGVGCRFSFELFRDW